MPHIELWDGEDGASASYVEGRLRVVSKPLMTAGNGRVTVEIDAPWIEQLVAILRELAHMPLRASGKDYDRLVKAARAHLPEWEGP